MEPQRPLRPQKFDITAEIAIRMTEEAKDELFQKDKEWLYGSILSKAQEGSYKLEYRFNENVRRKDVKKLQDELIFKGFEVEFKPGINDVLTINWYPME